MVISNAANAIAIERRNVGDWLQASSSGRDSQNARQNAAPKAMSKSVKYG